MSRRIAGAVAAGVGIALAVLGEKRRDQVLAWLATRLAPVKRAETPGGPVEFWCPSTYALYYPRVMLSDDPLARQWIGTFGPNDVLWDIGANVGLFTLYAARAAGIRVLALEPGAANHWVLNRNIEINTLQDRVSAYALAFSDESGLQSLNLSTSEPGAVFHVFGKPEGDFGYDVTYATSQAAVGFTIDDFVRRFAPPFPTHIKLDVDNYEARILAGGRETIADARLKSVLVEIAEHVDAPDIPALLAAAGLAEHTLPGASDDQRPFRNRLFVRNG